MKKPLSLRSMLVTLTIVVTLLAVMVSGALVALTTILHRTTVDIGGSVDSVRLAEEAEIDLLLLERVTDPVVKRDIEADLKRKLIDARGSVTSDEAARVLAEAEREVEAYIVAGHDPQLTAADRAAQQEIAYGALEAVVTINVIQSEATRQEAARLDRLGTILGIGVGALLILVAAAVLVWLRGRAFEPVFALASTMQRFGAGDGAARADERGPREIREMCTRFNEMASGIASQRQAQIAFLGGVAHDLRNPLSALQMSVSLLGRDKRLASDDRFRQMMSRMGRQITRMERMVGDFLDVSKIEAGHLDLRFDIHDAGALVHEVVDLFDEASQTHHLEVRAPREPLLVRCDHLRMEQVITNLISNAIKYSPAGSAIDVLLAARADELELSVTDHGIGMSEEDQSRVFDPFRRVGLSEETVPGVGLGLYVVRKIVEAHRGRIEVSSVRGGGSTFRVFLPMAGDEQTQLGNVPVPLH